jgi:uncharacterized protein involved in exopolysaccharide biosynthesis
MNDMDGDRISVIDLLNVMLRHARLLIIFPMAMAMVFALSRFTQPREYQASATFLPQGADGGRLPAAGLASQFGINLPGDRVGEGPQFYAELLRARPLLEAVLTSRYEFEQDGGRVVSTLLELYGIRDGSREARYRGYQRLRSSMDVRSSLQTGLVSVSVRASSPDLAEAVTARLLELLNDFNLETRQSGAANEERFVAERMVEVEAELRHAEMDLQQFLRGNRGFQQSPELVFEHDRLQRAVAIRQNVFNALAEAHERARVSAVRNTPVLTVVEPPAGTAAPVARGTILWAIMGGLVGAVLAILLALFIDVGRAASATDRPDIHEFNRLRRELTSGLRRPFHRVFTRAGR